MVISVCGFSSHSTRIRRNSVNGMRPCDDSPRAVAPRSKRPVNCTGPPSLQKNPWRAWQRCRRGGKSPKARGSIGVSEIGAAPMATQRRVRPLAPRRRTNMRDTKDSSLLFSLKALEELETNRIEEERAVEERARAAEERQRARVERLAREAEVRRIEEEEKRRLEAERARREEQARLEAEKLAAIERVRAEVDARSRADLARAQAAQDIELAKVRSTAATGRYRFLLALSALAIVAIGAIAGVLSKSLSERTEEDLRRASALESARKEREEVQAALNGARREIGDLHSRLRTYASSSAAPVATKDPPAKEIGGKPGPKKPTRKEEPTQIANCEDGDPLGGCLPSKKK